MLTLNERKKEKEGGMYVVLYICIALALVFSVVIFISFRLFHKETNEQVEVKETNTFLDTDFTEPVELPSTNIENLVNSDADINTIIEQATKDVTTFTYTVYSELDTYWNKELSEEEEKQLLVLGLDEQSLAGLSLLALVGNITPDKAILTVFNQRQMLYVLEAKSIQTMYDFNIHKSAQQITDIITQTSSDWIVNPIESQPIQFEDFFTDLEFNSITENEDNYVINGTYKYNSAGKNNIVWVMTYIFSLYDLSLQNDIPLYVVIDKSTMHVREIVYDLSELKHVAVLDNYDIVRTQLKVTMTDINTTIVSIPEEVQKKLKQ